MLSGGADDVRAVWEMSRGTLAETCCSKRVRCMGDGVQRGSPSGHPDPSTSVYLFIQIYIYYIYLLCLYHDSIFESTSHAEFMSGFCILLRCAKKLLFIVQLLHAESS